MESALGAGGRGFESRYPDEKIKSRKIEWCRADTVCIGFFRLCKLDTIIPRFGANKEGISLNYL